MLWFYRFIRGYVAVLFRGDGIERILNIAAANRISLWNTRLCKEGITACVSVKDFKKLPFVIRKSGIRVHILSRKGLPFKTAKNRKRTGLVCGAVIFFLFLEVMSGFVWQIEIRGNSAVAEAEILAACQSIGIHRGLPASKINPKVWRERLLLECDSLAWASINVEGCCVTVNVTEIQKPAEDTSAPCNLKAKADGIIKKLDVTSGNCVVKTGDTVKTGDLLVSGILERADGTEFVHSSGTVTAVTKRNIVLEGKYKRQRRDETGKVKKKYLIDLFGLKIPLFVGGESEKYNSDLKVSTLSLFGKNLPISLYRKEFRFVREYEYTLSHSELCEFLMGELARRLKAEGIGEYEVLSSDFTENRDGVTLSALVSAEENIAVKETVLVAE
ncbi:MAG: sporulation protein YqfD [Clostridia bacterium]|nr:sporulation protein YqfD [Clostridia bacterium]